MMKDRRVLYRLVGQGHSEMSIAGMWIVIPNQEKCDGQAVGETIA